MTVLSSDAFLEQLKQEGRSRYHNRHPFHLLMHEGKLSRPQLQQWVLNRYYYQTRIPIKDALILAKSEDPTFRRLWIRRIHDQDGTDEADGGLALWRRLASDVGLDEDRVKRCEGVLPGVRFACDVYVSLVRDASLVEAVAASLTELFAPDLMRERILAWELHYPWVGHSALDYFRVRVRRAGEDGNQALAFVLTQATTSHQQTACLNAVIRKTEMLWHILDCLYATSVLQCPTTVLE